MPSNLSLSHYPGYAVFHVCEDWSLKLLGWPLLIALDPGTLAYSRKLQSPIVLAAKSAKL